MGENVEKMKYSNDYQLYIDSNSKISQKMIFFKRRIAGLLNLAYLFIMDQLNSKTASIISLILRINLETESKSQSM